MDKLSDLVKEVIVEQLRYGRPEAREIAQHIVDNYETEYAQYQTETSWSGLVRIVKDHLRKMSGGDANLQLSLPGFDFPAVIAVRDDKRVYYVLSANATLSELEAGELERIENVDAAQAKLDAYRSSLDRVRPTMLPNPSMTLGEALRKIAVKP